MLDTASCRRQEQECLALAASTTHINSKRLYAEMAKMWFSLSNEADSSIALRRFLDQIIR